MGVEWIDDLDEVLTDGVLPGAGPNLAVPPAADVDEVNRLLRKRRSLVAEQAEIDRIRDVEVDRVAMWHFDRTAVVEGALGRIDRALDGWARMRLREEGVKTHKLPHGTLRLRPHRKSVVVDDADVEVLSQEHPQAVRWRAEVDRKAVVGLYEEGAVVAEHGDGTIEVEVVERLVDEATGEVVDRVLPGVTFRVADAGERGYGFTVTS